MGHQVGRRHAPISGSKGFWPRKRAKSARARIKTGEKRGSYSPAPGAQLFAGYKAGMTHIQVTDNRKTSRTKGQKIEIPATVIETPDIKVFGVRFYNKSPRGMKSVGEIWAENLDKNLSRTLRLPKKKKDEKKEQKEWPEFDYLTLLCHTKPTFKKTPEVFEVPVSGTAGEQKSFANERLGKDLKAADVISVGDQVDVIAITKAKGFQGAVKRFGVRLLQHKSAKTRRKAGTLGSWNPNIILPHTAMPGQMGFHQRIDFNKWLLATGNGKDITPKGDFPHYGKIKTSYILVSGSVPGQKKRLVFMRKAIRPNNRMPKQVPDMEYVSRESKQ